MTRRRKDPLRPLTNAECCELTRLRRSSAAPAAQVARAAALLLVSAGADYQDAARAVGRKSGDAVSHLVARFNREGLAALEPRHGGGQVTAYDAAACARILREVARRPPRSGTGQRPGLSRPCGTCCGRPPTACRASRPSPYGESCTRPATATSRPAPGVPPARPSASARPVSSPSPIPTPGQKKVDRGRLPAGRSVGPAGLVLRPGGPLPDRPPPRPELATGGSAGSATARVHPQRDSQGSHTVPPRRRAHARRGRDDVPQRGAAPLAEAGTVRGPGRVARASAHGAGIAGRVGGAGSRGCPSSRRCRRNWYPYGCCWYWTTWRGTRRRRSSCGCSRTGSCRSTLPWAVRG